MMKQRFSRSVQGTLLLAVLLGAACQQTIPVSNGSTSPDQSAAERTEEGPILVAQEVPTEPLQPQPIQITPDQLPEPYATESARSGPEVVSIPENPVLQVPDGFQVNVFAEGLDQPRWLALTPTGEVLVTETAQDRIQRLRDADGDGVAEIQDTFADRSNGLNRPFGMTFGSGYFFLGNKDGVLRFPYETGQTRIEGQGEKIADLPSGGHWTRNVVVSPDEQQLFVAIGSRSNVDPEPLPRASVQVMNLDGSNMTTFADGLRNPVGLAFHPITQKPYVTVNERDGLGDDLVPDYLTQLQEGQFYGWPYAYLTPDRLDPRRSQNGQSEQPELAAQTAPPDVLFQAHSAALGLDFYGGSTFPERYRNGAFVAFRGSWNRSQGTGYKIVFVPFTEAGEPEGYYEDFVTGFLLDPAVPTVWGRPVSILALPDGSILFTEEANGRIYRVQYQGS